MTALYIAILMVQRVFFALLALCNIYSVFEVEDAPVLMRVVAIAVVTVAWYCVDWYLRRDIAREENAHDDFGDDEDDFE